MILRKFYKSMLIARADTSKMLAPAMEAKDRNNEEKSGIIKIW